MDHLCWEYANSGARDVLDGSCPIAARSSLVPWTRYIQFSKSPSSGTIPLSLDRFGVANAIDR